MTFRVEKVFERDGSSVVLARQLGSGDFAVTRASCLAGVPVSAMSQPRATTAAGTPDLSLFAFTLTGPEHISAFAEGQHVELQP